MKPETFNQLISCFMDKTLGTLTAKAAEYADDTWVDDRLHNFRIASAFQQITQKQALFGFLTKHLVSLSDMIRTDETHTYSTEMWEEKIGDAINYLLLLRGLVEEDGRHDLLPAEREDFRFSPNRPTAERIQPLTQEEVDYACELFLKGLDIAEISVLLGKSCASVRPLLNQKKAEQDYGGTIRAGVGLNEVVTDEPYFGLPSRKPR